MNWLPLNSPNLLWSDVLRSYMKLSNKRYKNFAFLVFCFIHFFFPTTTSTTIFFWLWLVKMWQNRRLPFFPRANFAKTYQNRLTHNRKLKILLNWTKFTFLFKMKFFRQKLYLPWAIHRYAWRNFVFCFSELNFLNICPECNRHLLKHL